MLFLDFISELRPAATRRADALDFVQSSPSAKCRVDISHIGSVRLGDQFGGQRLCSLFSSASIGFDLTPCDLNLDQLANKVRAVLVGLQESAKAVEGPRTK
jgi:hypothetical protein